jgi:hypothetical protein
VTDTGNMLVARNSVLMEQPVDDDIFGLEPKSGNFYGVNASAARIWTLIEQPITLAAICDALTAEFDVSPATCRDETLALLRELEKDALVTLTPLDA